MSVRSLPQIEPRTDIPAIAPGDTVKVKFKGGGRQRAQAFKGTVIGMRRGGTGVNLRVRQIFHGIGVERTFPLYSPLLEQVEVLRRGKARRAKLYYLRGLSRKKARLKVKAKG